MPKTICLLGSTGSIGESCLDVVRAHPGRFRIGALAVASRAERVLEQAAEFRPARVAIADESAAARVAEGFRRLGIPLATGPGAAATLAAGAEADVVVNALVGAAGLVPTLAALERGVDVALANKESLVLGGPLVLEASARTGARVIPVDSEHSALHQLLEGIDRAQVRRLVLTASGGPFLRHDAAALARVTPSEALRHPTWNMGKRITVDSATLVNKGLEVIETHWFFGVSVEEIGVIVHPQSIVHAMVEMADGSCIAQLASTDMRLPIQYALTYPDRVPGPAPPLDLAAAGPLTFEIVDADRFPCLGLAYEAARTGGTAPALLNAADEIAVAAFLDGKIAFTSIARVVEGVLRAERAREADSVEAVLRADSQGRERARTLVASLALAP